MATFLKMCLCFCTFSLTKGQGSTDTESCVEGSSLLQKDADIHLSTILESSTATASYRDAPSGYTRLTPGCVRGANIAVIADKSVQECADLCNADSSCLAFEYGVNHGGASGAVVERDCRPQSSANSADCDGHMYNLDLYTKQAQHTTAAPTTAARTTAAPTTAAPTTAWIVVADPPHNGKKCTRGSTDRVFDLRNVDATEASCVRECEEHDTCVAFSGIFGQWCVGCSATLSQSHSGAIAYKKVQAVSPQSGICPAGYSASEGLLRSYGDCEGTLMTNQCILQRDDAQSFCDSISDCGGFSESSYASWQWPGAFFIGKLGPTLGFANWKSCVKQATPTPAPTLAPTSPPPTTAAPTTTAAAPWIGPDRIHIFDWQTFQLLNAEREKGFTCTGYYRGEWFTYEYEPNPTKMIFDCGLWRAAFLHAKDMVENNFWSHYSQDGRDWIQRAAEQGVNYGASETLAKGFMSPRENINAWKGSRGHCMTLGNRGFQTVGIAAYLWTPQRDATWKGGSRYYYVAAFGYGPGSHQFGSSTVDQSCLDASQQQGISFVNFAGNDPYAGEGPTNADGGSIGEAISADLEGSRSAS